MSFMDSDHVLHHVLCLNHETIFSIVNTTKWNVALKEWHQNNIREKNLVNNVMDFLEVTQYICVVRHIAPVDNSPQPESIIPVEEVWYIFQPTFYNIIHNAEGLVGHWGQWSLHDFDDTFSTRSCNLENTSKWQILYVFLKKINVNVKVNVVYVVVFNLRENAILWY